MWWLPIAWPGQSVSGARLEDAEVSVCEEVLLLDNGRVHTATDQKDPFFDPHLCSYVTCVPLANRSKFGALFWEGWRKHRGVFQGILECLSSKTPKLPTPCSWAGTRSSSSAWATRWTPERRSTQITLLWKRNSSCGGWHVEELEVV